MNILRRKPHEGVVCRWNNYVLSQPLAFTVRSVLVGEAMREDALDNTNFQYTGKKRCGFTPILSIDSRLGTSGIERLYFLHNKATSNIPIQLTVKHGSPAGMAPGKCSILVCKREDISTSVLHCFISARMLMEIGLLLLF